SISARPPPIELHARHAPRRQQGRCCQTHAGDGAGAGATWYPGQRQRTGRHRHGTPWYGHTELEFEVIARQILLGRMGERGKVATVAVVLLSSDVRHVAGGRSST